MNITIKINCDNAAFEDYASLEVARILLDLANRVEDRPNFSPGTSLPVRDINGNVVGIFEVEE